MRNWARSWSIVLSRSSRSTHWKKRKRKKKFQSFSKRHRRFKTLAVQLEEDLKEKNLSKNTKDAVPCVVCAKIYDLEQCKAYLTKSVDERSKYLSNKKLCYGCLKPISKTHTVRNNVEPANFATKNILHHCMDLSWKRKPSKELSMIYLIKVTRYKRGFWKATLQYVTKTLFAHPLKTTPRWTVCVWCLS